MATSPAGIVVDVDELKAVSMEIEHRASPVHNTQLHHLNDSQTYNLDGPRRDSID
jgi:hypothetical protein